VNPPFLDGRFSFSKQMNIVPTIKEPTSDFAILSQKGKGRTDNAVDVLVLKKCNFHLLCPGSALLRERREKRERGKMRHRFWELGGSRMGEAMGIKAEAVDGEGQVVKKEGNGEEFYDYRAESKFSEHLKSIKHEVHVNRQS